MAVVREFMKYFHDVLKRYLNIIVVSKHISQADGFLLFFAHPFSPVKHTVTYSGVTQKELRSRVGKVITYFVFSGCSFTVAKNIFPGTS